MILKREVYIEIVITQITIRTHPWNGHAAVSYSSATPSSLPATQAQRSKAVLPLMGASEAALRCRSQKATVGAWFKSARQSGSSVGLRVFAT